MKSIWTFLSLLIFIRHIAGQQTQDCDSGTGVCVAFEIPLSAGEDSQSADIYVTVQAPGYLGWVGFGFGERMTGSLIFVMWPDGSNVIVSPRYAYGHFEPEPISGPGASVISSSVTSSSFQAQLQLSNATSWMNSGSLDTESTDAGVIWALGTTPPSDPSNPDSNFQQHQTMGNFAINMKQAQVQVATGTASIPTETGTGTTQATTTSEVTGVTFPAGPKITGDVTPVGKLGLTYRDKVIIAHGVIMGVAFVILFPLGAIFIRFLSSVLPVPTKLHYILQLFSLTTVIAGMGLGIYLSKGIQFHYFHQIFGIIIIVLLTFQASLGYYHHRRFIRDKPSSRRWFTHLHLWLGRSLIVCGLINCGFGLNLAPVSWRYVIIWWVVCGALAVTYAVSSIATAKYRRRQAGEAFGNAGGPGFSPNRYKTAENYEMMSSRGMRPGRM